MMFRRLVHSLIWLAGSLSGALLDAADSPDFDKQVAPILAGRCLDCHRGAEPQGKLDLSFGPAALRGGESGLAIVGGQPDDSLLWQRIVAGEMPPKHPLPDAERAVLHNWIAAGARWGTERIDPFRYTSAARAGYDWWSLQALSPPAPPALADPAWDHNDIDRFIRAKLIASNLTPSPPAQRQALVRRLYFDLLGLPPTPEQLQEDIPYEALVDRLLQSPHYGERWARHWLDVAHFGESDGFEYDRMRPHAWRYRDWVIAALNRDLPYDEFARLQIAGDVLRPSDEQALIATGFLVGGAHDSLLPKGDVMQKIMRQDELEDLVSLVGQTFLGLTVNCARCHDHKFDPIRQEDYYRLAAALAGVKRGNRDLPPLEPPADLHHRHAQAKEQLAAIESSARVLALAAREQQRSTGVDPPLPISRWEFDGDLRDSIGALHGTFHGRTRLDKGQLVIDGPDAYVSTAALEKDVAAKTLEVWVRTIKPEQRGGAAISLQTYDGQVFDAIVYGEKQPRRWIAGSNHFRRTQPLAGVVDETEARGQFIHLAAVYHADGRISFYRGGQPYGETYPTSGPVTFEAGKSQILFGLRHLPVSEGKILSARIERACLYDRALSADEVAASANAVRTEVTEAELLAQLDAPSQARRAELKTTVLQLEEQLAPFRNRQVFAVNPQPAPVVNLLVRGNVLQPEAEVCPGGIGSLITSQPDFGLPSDASDKQRRIKLAEWITSPANPLFARTIVNRVWQYHFGRGLVETPNDLGFSGGQPSHPELLDWLAGQLVGHDWSLKQLHRLIVTSATYRQAAAPRPECLAIDADNRLLWRHSPSRLDAECVRDAMLVASGKLNTQSSGPGYHDFRPYVFRNTQYYEPIDPVGDDVHRRSIYRFWARGGRNPLLDTFDCPDPSTAAPRRSSTTTPLQALAMLNNSFTLRMADECAQRLLRDCPSNPSEQIRRAFELTYGRSPRPAELQESSEFVAQHGLAPFCRVLLNSNGFLYVD